MTARTRIDEQTFVWLTVGEMDALVAASVAAQSDQASTPQGVYVELLAEACPRSTASARDLRNATGKLVDTRKEMRR